MRPHTNDVFKQHTTRMSNYLRFLWESRASVLHNSVGKGLVVRLLGGLTLPENNWIITLNSEMAELRGLRSTYFSTCHPRSPVHTLQLVFQHMLLLPRML
jgi:hypothetical protein